MRGDDGRDELAEEEGACEAVEEGERELGLEGRWWDPGGGEAIDERGEGGVEPGDDGRREEGRGDA